MADETTTDEQTTDERTTDDDLDVDADRPESKDELPGNPEAHENLRVGSKELTERRIRRHPTWQTGTVDTTGTGGSTINEVSPLAVTRPQGATPEDLGQPRVRPADHEGGELGAAGLQGAEGGQERLRTDDPRQRSQGASAAPSGGDYGEGPLSDRTNAQLTAVAASSNVKVPANANKGQILAALDDAGIRD